MALTFQQFSDYSEASSGDTSLSGVIPLVSPNGSFKGHTSNSNPNSIGYGDIDLFAIDLVGGSHDSALSIGYGTLQISYTVSGGNSIGFNWQGFAYNGSIPISTSDQHQYTLAGSGTLNVSLPYYSNPPPQGDGGYMFKINPIGFPVETDYTLQLKFIPDGTGPGTDVYTTGEGASAAAAQLGDHVFVNGRIGDNGNADVSNVKVDYYLSSDATITSADHFLGEITIPTIRAHSDVGYSVASTVAGVAPGSYYLGFIVDPSNDPNPTNNATSGTPFKVFGATIDGLHPVYRYNDTATGDHFYTINPAEKAAIQPGIAAFAYEHVPWATPDKGAGTVDVFRFFDTVTQTHFLTSSVAERDQIIAGTPTLNYEGTAFQAYAAVQDSGEFALERFYNTNSHQHTYAADANEIALIKSGKVGSGWVDEGASFIVHHPTADMQLL